MEFKNNLIIFFTLLSFSKITNAALDISQFSISDTSIEFSISGSIEGPEPNGNSWGKRWIFLVSADGEKNWDNPGAFQNAQITSNISINNSNNPAVSDFWIETQGLSEDRLTMNFSNNLEIGDTLSGTFNATWGLAINTSYLIEDGLEFRWGRNPSAMQGALQGKTIPLPAGIYLFLSGLVGLGIKKRISHKG